MNERQWQEGYEAEVVAESMVKTGGRNPRRVVAFHRQGRARHKMRRRLVLSAGAVALLLVLSGVPVAYAGDIPVDGTICTLADAITAANTDTATGGCPAGSGADTLLIANDITLNAALPDITTTITIEGAGHTIQPGGGGFPAPILYVVGGVLGDGDLTLREATVSSGSGGVASNEGTVRIEGCTITDHAKNFGGGVANSQGTATIVDSTISGNMASQGAGVYSSGWLTITNSTISANDATQRGGGVYVDFGTATIVHSTISGNESTDDGGGVFVNFAEATIEHSIVSGNTTGGLGNEIHNDFVTTGDAFNLFGDDGETDAEAFENFAPGASDITATSDGTQPTALGDILDTALRDNGGRTRTHALVPGSPAIDAGDPAFVPPPNFDQRGPGFPRVVNGVIDIGAYEFRPQKPVGGVTVAPDGLAQLAPAAGLLAALAGLAGSGIALARRRKR